MSRNAPQHLLVCYDIGDPVRLRRIHRELKGWGMPVQYSVFYCLLAPGRRRALEAVLRELIDPRRDDVRIYVMAPLHRVRFLGVEPLPAGVQLL
ncbi:MAG: CRISPR-associated endonuclease Cas2 [Pseudomonadota bacterium]|nr:CRISPR-associated endonuclease Cas2 [Pseudomonadota bacterium]